MIHQTGKDVNRPADLPDFRKPPLNEVVIGVQFAPPRGYSQIRAGEVWTMFKADFPVVEEKPPLAPVFETFGRPQAAQMKLGFITGASHDRFWFLTSGKEELIQFQHDRLLHNWRKVGDQTNEYPRFERMIEKFERELGSLEGYFSTLEKQVLAINQCEVSYINHIPYDEAGASLPDQWIKFLKFGSLAPEDFSTTYNRVIRSPEGQPFGRLICEATTAITAGGKKVVRFTFTVRGAPERPDIGAALEYLKRGRETIVRTFAEATTELAHKAWERVQ